MASTEQRTSGDTTTADEPRAVSDTAETVAVEASEPAAPEAGTSRPDSAAIEEPRPADHEAAAASQSPPDRFMADLLMAMRTATEGSRSATTEQYRRDTKSFIERIHARSAEESTELRRLAEADERSIREWMRTEIARIRTQADERVAAREAALEAELEAHAGRIETQIDRVQMRTAGYEEEMERFFAQLTELRDASAFAAAAQQMPQPPDLFKEPEEASADAEAPPDDPRDAGTDLGVAESEAAAESAADTSAGLAADVAADTATDAARENPQTSVKGRLFSESSLAGRLAGLVPSSENPANGRSTAAQPTEPQPSAPTEPQPSAPTQPAAAPPATTQVVVVGLVSVASIASFKRHLGRTPGVETVAVSSGPESEFVFSTTHEPGLALRDVVPTLPGFGARVVKATDDTLNVTARDPEAEA